MAISLSLYVEPERLLLLPSKILLSGSSRAPPLLSTALILPLLGICFATARNVSRITTAFVHASTSVVGTFLDLIHIFVGLIRLFLGLVDLAVAIICLAVSLIRSVVRVAIFILILAWVCLQVVFTVIVNPLAILLHVILWSLH